ncbi:nuclear fragile X mental retardation-interacting protein 1 [Nephila pilipes]|uniref:Nuclear fragile X mental retardation-interacting protein 1 n=1 Tax=Nephila pilipes TaxID=299642 RepID=A0A8X6MG80_NEPPI|nr:nuclear fragile X mental retardation-interacting protein 1 [Nephila pilipes]
MYDYTENQRNYQSFPTNSSALQPNINPQLPHSIAPFQQSPFLSFPPPYVPAVQHVGSNGLTPNFAVNNNVPPPPAFSPATFHMSSQQLNNSVDQRVPDNFVGNGMGTPPSHFNVPFNNPSFPPYSLSQYNMHQVANDKLQNVSNFDASKNSFSSMQSDATQNFNYTYENGKLSPSYKNVQPRNNYKWVSMPYSNVRSNNDVKYERNPSSNKGTFHNSKFNSYKRNSNDNSAFSRNRMNQSQQNWKATQFDHCNKKEKTFNKPRNYQEKFHDRCYGRQNNLQIKKENEPKRYACDTCDRAFSIEADYQSHMSSHIICRVPNCQFEAHPAIVALHKKMQHDTGYADEINKFKNADDIEKWRAERKRRFPTAENILKRKAEQSEKEARGEVIEEKEFGKFKKRKQDQNASCNKWDGTYCRKRKRSQFRKRNDKPYMKSNVPSISLCSDTDSDDDSHIKLPRFLGIFASTKADIPKDIPVNGSTEEFPIDAVEDTNHLEDMKKRADLSETDCNETASEVLDVNEISSQYETKEKDAKIQDIDLKSIEDDVHDEDSVQIPFKDENAFENTASSQNHKNDQDHKIQDIDLKPIEDDSDNEAPTQIPIVKKENAFENTTSSQNHKNDQGAKCSKIFSKREQIKASNNRYGNANHNSFRKQHLLEKLLADQIKTERNIIMQCVRHVVKNDFFGIGK